jgi:hypothetical protein
MSAMIVRPIISFKYRMSKAFIAVAPKVLSVPGELVL